MRLKNKKYETTMIKIFTQKSMIKIIMGVTSVTLKNKQL